MMEVLAGIVTVAQLLGYAVKSIDSVIEIYQNLKGVSGRLQDHLAQIRTLSYTVQNIKNDDLLDAEHMRHPLEQLIISIQNLKLIVERLQSRLNRSFFTRVRKASIQNADFDRLDESLRHIEADKGTLLLSITHMHAEAFLEDRQRRTSASPHSGQSIRSRPSAESSGPAYRSARRLESPYSLGQHQPSATRRSTSSNEYQTTRSKSMSGTGSTSKGKASDAKTSPPVDHDIGKVTMMNGNKAYVATTKEDGTTRVGEMTLGNNNTFTGGQGSNDTLQANANGNNGRTTDPWCKGR